MSNKNELLSTTNETPSVPAYPEQAIGECTADRLSRKLAKGVVAAAYLTALAYIDIKLAGK